MRKLWKQTILDEYVEGKISKKEGCEAPRA
ncbi:hypothetical protein HKBW3S03_00207 [Candidatus Hakubella thermalkaliphila]|uniref:Uncharacterized protein n=1 Tax=Candidatus Hakubella thermalkaliphila TaxID=2754717 RepID=A0A6V8NEM0_9ACTN|nr:hypothetical protein HKBW3S03_00207 [Candidatus Hakubella thermalkaliphila]GFP23518.1 hypothetical protein HKBW3S09_00985 [Candidatus Hakubella thermalkaliphila]GFP38419.1 hypothetical protein HKBW3S47_00120 [Candidatus Hakubella thermalkaliphila]GFP40963.1 hypothetical protein HKBW3C_00088 [Candidatus Hakubella thermalkaliphila]